MLIKRYKYFAVSNALRKEEFQEKSKFQDYSAYLNWINEVGMTEENIKHLIWVAYTKGVGNTTYNIIKAHDAGELQFAPKEDTSNV